MPQLLPIATLGLGGTPAGRLTSESTHVDGVVAGIDITPTVLEHLGLAVPDVVKGQPITSEPGRDAAALERLADRLRVVVPRRLPALWTLLTTWLVVLLAATLVADRRGLRWSMRIGALAILWVPTVVLITAALRPSRLAELLLVTALALTLGMLTDRLVAWPRGPAVPAVARARGLHARPGARVPADHPLAARPEPALRLALLRDRQRARRRRSPRCSSSRSARCCSAAGGRSGRSRSSRAADCCWR